MTDWQHELEEWQERALDLGPMEGRQELVERALRHAVDRLIGGMQKAASDGSDGRTPLWPRGAETRILKTADGRARAEVDEGIRVVSMMLTDEEVGELGAVEDVAPLLVGDRETVVVYESGDSGKGRVRTAIRHFGECAVVATWWRKGGKSLAWSSDPRTGEEGPRNPERQLVRLLIPRPDERGWWLMGPADDVDIYAICHLMGWDWTQIDPEDYEGLPMKVRRVRVNPEETRTATAFNDYVPVLSHDEKTLLVFAAGEDDQDLFTRGYAVGDRLFEFWVDTFDGSPFSKEVWLVHDDGGQGGALRWRWVTRDDPAVVRAIFEYIGRSKMT